MTRVRRLLIAVSAVLVASLSVAAPAAADPLDDAVAALRSSSVYAGAPSPKIEPAKLGGDTLSGIKVAILPTGGPNALAVARSIGERLDSSSTGLTVLVFEGTSYGAASTARCNVGTAIDDAVNSNRSQLRSSDDVTVTVADFAANVRRQPSASGGACNRSAPTDSGSGTAGTADQGSSGSSHTGLIVLLVVVALIVGAVGYVRRSRRRRTERELSDARAQVMPYYDRLAGEMNNIDPEDDPTARQAMADAGERFTSAGSQLATADSVEKYAQARRTTLEGLYAARTARTALGLDPGPELPSIAERSGDQLDAPRQVSVQGETFQGYPSYTPGAPYYYGGGYGVPGGWYGVPFWETMLLGGLVASSFGGFGGGYGGYGMGYDNGYGTGYDAGHNAADGQGGDAGWGDSGGGGNWGDAGGWGDSGGGGDWGGGGGGGGDGGGGDGGGSW
jgi:hypothetical protein